MTELKIKCPLVYLKEKATSFVFSCSLFSLFFFCSLIPNPVKNSYFPPTCLFTTQLPMTTESTLKDRIAPGILSDNFAPEYVPQKSRK